jgi:hypothetical protein
MSEPEGYIVGGPIKFAPGVPAVERACDICGTAVWVSRVMLPEVESGKMLPACLECAEKHMDADPKQEMALREQQLSELEALGILEYARGYVDIMNAMQQVRRLQT